jgi:hypothetical protein
MVPPCRRDKWSGIPIVDPDEIGNRRSLVAGYMDKWFYQKMLRPPPDCVLVSPDVLV